jgi:hypothetical protein
VLSSAKPTTLGQSQRLIVRVAFGIAGRDRSAPFPVSRSKIPTRYWHHRSATVAASAAEPAASVTFLHCSQAAVYSS